MFDPTMTGSGESDLVTKTSARVLTVVVIGPDVLLLGLNSGEVLVVAEAVLVIVLRFAALGLTFTMISKLALSPLSSPAERVLVMVPVPPAGGVEVVAKVGPVF